MEKTARALLIIFYKNPVKGKVKTRLAATLGDEKALKIFQDLAEHTKSATQNLAVDKVVFYSDFIESGDLWSGYNKACQRGSDLGERMENAFDTGFDQGYKSICIIGTDCFELTEEILTDAFLALEKNDAVIGPARDGGYYLLGLNSPSKHIFRNKRWSTERVFHDTVEDLTAAGWRYATLSVLRDVDTEEDLPNGLRGELT